MHVYNFGMLGIYLWLLNFYYYLVQEAQQDKTCASFHKVQKVNKIHVKGQIHYIIFELKFLVWFYLSRAK